MKLPLNRLCRRIPPASIDFFRACRASGPGKAATARIAPQFVIENIPRYEDDEKSIAKLKLYLSPATGFIPSENQVVFWNKVAVEFPRLFDIALICLNVPVDEVPAEN